MPSTTTPMPTLSPTPTYNNSTIMSITRATVVSFDKNPNDQKIWYKIRVEPTSGKKYFISRKYDDFCQLSQKLHDRFYNNNKSTTTTKSFVLPAKLIKHRIQLLPLNKQERLQELNHFLFVLFQKQQLPNILADSYIVLEFFQDVFLDYQEYTAAVINDSLPNDIVTPTPSTSSRWKRLRCTSFLASRSPPTGLSSLCSQAANKIIPSWHRTHHHQPNNSNLPKPSVSTPAIHTLNSQPMRQNNKQVLKKSKSSLGIYASVNNKQVKEEEESSSKIQIPTPTPTTSTIMIQPKDNELKTTIKIKVIYDKENIIVIQVPRTISLTELRSRISQKFSELNMVNDSELVLLFNDNSSSCSSSILSSSNDHQILLPAVLLTKDQDLSQIMHTKWNRLEKVTLRCII